MESFYTRLKRPSGIALVYFLFGISWILVTDFLVLAIVDDTDTVTFLQTAKGWVFVGGSTLLIFGLVWYGTNELQSTNKRLDDALGQVSILHRLLRHNLRNNCNVINGNVDLLDEKAPATCDTELDSIRTKTNQLADLSAKTRFLRDLVLEEGESTQQLDLVSVIEGPVESMRSRHPELVVETDLPEEFSGRFDPRLNRAITELIENAVEHNDRDEPTVKIGMRSNPGGSVEITIQDDGPGMPEMEREVLSEGLETPMFHSEGLGLWIVRTIVSNMGGRLRVRDNKPRGTIVTILLNET